MKLRGSQNIMALNTCEDVGVGMNMTGNGITPDAQNANGSGNIAALNTGTNINDDAVGVGIQDGYYQRGSIVALNTFDDIVSTGGNGAVRGVLLDGSVVSLNSFSNIACDYGMLLSGTVGSEQNGLVLLGNTITNLTGAQQGFRVQYAERAFMAGNTGTSVAGLVQTRFVTDSVFLGNINPDGSYAVFSNSTNSNSDNLVIGQRGASLVNAPTHPGGLNFPSASLPLTSTTPATIGLLTTASGVGYVSTGVGSSADWKQIT